MRTATFLSFPAVLLLAQACVIDPDAIGTDSATMSAEGFTTLTVEVEEGDLVITGAEEATEITADLEVWRGLGGDRQDECAMDALRIELRDLGDGEGRLSVFFDPEMPMFWVNTTLSLPSTLALLVVDGSGDAEIQGVAGLDLADGSGDATIYNIEGDVTVIDGSGDLDIDTVIGGVTVEDGSGDLSVTRVCEDATIVDGSGDIFVDDVGGMVTINDGSGDIEIGAVGGLEILEGGSGEVYVR